MKKHLTIIIAASMLASCTTIKNGYHSSKTSLGPFFRSLILNQNVYKTKDTISLTKVYNNKKGERVVVHDDNTYLLTVPPKSDSTRGYSFIRYTLVKDGDLQVIRVPDLTEPATMTPNNKALVKLGIASDGVDASDYYYAIKYAKAIEPGQKYLATEHLTGLPLVIPIKARFNVPGNQEIFNLSASLAYAFGYKIRVNNNPYKDNYIRLILISAGLGTDTYLKRDSVYKSGYKGEQSIALTFGSGLTYEVSDKWNFGLFLGFDQMFGDKKDWYYQNKAWLGVGFGFKFGGDAGK
jgi:hypothetical protein